MVIKEGECAKKRKIENENPSKKPRSDYTTSSNLVKFLKSAFESTCITPRKSAFTFENTEEAAKTNSKILLSFGGNVKRAIASEKGSMLTPATEFRDQKHIKPLFDLHEDGD